MSELQHKTACTWATAEMSVSQAGPTLLRVHAFLFPSHSQPLCLARISPGKGNTDRDVSSCTAVALLGGNLKN